MTSPVYDVHSHAVLDIGDGVDAGLGVPISALPPWSASASLELMDRSGISVSLISMPESGVHVDRRGNRDRARRVNEFLTDLRSAAPGRRGALVALPADTDDALGEVAHGLDVLHMDGVSLPTSIDGTYLGDTRFDPLLEELDRRGATLFVHPTMPTLEAPFALGLNPSILEFPFDTTRMISNLMLNGTLHRFPRIRIATSHGGGAIGFLLTRIQTLVPVFGPGPDGRQLDAAAIAADARLLYYDVTAATAPHQLAALVETVGADRLLAGFDIPYMPSDSIAPAIESLRTWSGFDAAEREAVLSGTARDLFPAAAARAEETTSGAG